MRRAWGNNIDRILMTLRECGPMTEEQLRDKLGMGQGAMASALHKLRNPSPRHPRRIYVMGWTSKSVDPKKKRHLRPIFAAGKLSDAGKPTPIAPDMPKPVRRRLIAARAVAESIHLAGVPGRCREPTMQEWATSFLKSCRQA